MKKFRASVDVVRLLNRTGVQQQPSNGSRESSKGGSVPHATGFAGIREAQQASVSIAELCRQIGKATEKWESDGQLDEDTKAEFARIDERATQYSNSSLAIGDAVGEWQGSLLEAQIVYAAWQCSQAVYQEDPSFETTTHNATVIKVVPAANSAQNVTTLTLLEGAPDNPLLPAVVVAVRGTTSMIDHNVISKATPVRLQGFVDLSALTDSYNDDISGTTAHGGFLASAKELSKVLSLELKQILNSKTARHLVFTGHAGGGAVASLLYMHWLSGEQAYQDLAKTRHSQTCNPEHADMTYHITNKFSCITFGAPPVTSRDLTDIFGGRSYGAGPGIVLSIVNEHDPVGRVDRAYMRLLVDLYRASYSIEKVPDDSATGVRGSKEEKRIRTSKESKRSLNVERPATERGSLGVLELPQPRLWAFGAQVVLKVDDSAEKPELKALEVDAHTFVKLIFARVSEHRRLAYDERIKKILDGKFNGKDGW